VRENAEAVAFMRGEDAERGFGADAAHFHQLAEGGALGFAGEAEQQMGIFAHDELGVDVDALADVGQLVKGLHGDFQLVADAVKASAVSTPCRNRLFILGFLVQQHFRHNIL